MHCGRIGTSNNMTSQSFSYPCRNEIHRYLGLEKRMDLIKLVPALRVQNKTLGYHLTNVLYFEYSQKKVCLKLDETKIVIRETANESDDQNIDVVVEIWNPSGTPTPSKQAELKNCDQNAGIQTMAEKMVAFYLDRPGTFVHEYVEGIQFEHLRKWRNCIRTDSLKVDETISTTGWWRELVRKIRSSHFFLHYDSTPGVLLEIVKSVNSHFPIGTSVVLKGISPDEMHAVDQLKHELPGATTDSGWGSITDDISERWLRVTYPSHLILVEISLHQESVTITKKKYEPCG